MLPYQMMFIISCNWIEGMQIILLANTKYGTTKSSANNSSAPGHKFGKTANNYTLVLYRHKKEYCSDVWVILQHREMNVHLRWENTDDWEQMMDWLKSIRFWWNLKYHVTSKLYYSQWLIETPLAHKYLCHVWTRRDLDSYGFKPWNRVGIRLYHGMVISHTASKPAAMVLFEDSFSNLSKSHMQWCHLEHWQGGFLLIL